MKYLPVSKALLLVFLLISFYSCQKDNDPQEVATSMPASAFSSDVPLQWHKLFEVIDRYAPGYRPPAAARALAYIGLAGYEAAVPGMEDYNSMASSFSGLLLPTIEEGVIYHWPTAANAAYHVMFQKLYPHIQADHLTAIAELNQSFEDKYAGQLDAGVFNRSKSFGEAVANAVYTWSATDLAGHEAYLDAHPASYAPPAGLGLWQPTWPDYTPALFPYWGQVRPFAMTNADLLARSPLPWGSDPNAQIYIQVKETQVWVDNIRAGNDEESRWVAEFWSDDFGGVTFTSPGRWIAIANKVVSFEQPSLETSVRLYAQMGMALLDASVAVWKSKFFYNYERPIQYIRRNFNPNWKTILNNPATGVTGLNPEFPAYPSGHSGFGGAAAVILTNIFGYPYNFTDNCHKDRTEFNGTPRSFSSFIDMAVENAYSRIPIGVHFRMDCDEGLRQGYLAGQRVLELPWRK